MIILPGINSIQLVEVAVLLILALSSDIRSYKIKNPIVALFILIGAMTNFALLGYAGLRLSFLGLVTPIIILFFFFAASMLGAGDIKLFAAIGSIVGWRVVVIIMSYSFLTGGVIAAALMVKRRNAAERFRHLFEYFRTCIMTFSIASYTNMSDKSDGAKFRFAYAITLGVLIFIFLGK